MSLRSDLGVITDTNKFPDWAAVVNHPDVISLGSNLESFETSSAASLDVTIQQPL
jgi:hypothetical protein